MIKNEQFIVSESVMFESSIDYRISCLYQIIWYILNWFIIIYMYEFTLNTSFMHMLKIPQSCSEQNQIAILL